MCLSFLSEDRFIAKASNIQVFLKNLVKDWYSSSSSNHRGTQGSFQQMQNNTEENNWIPFCHVLQMAAYNKTGVAETVIILGP